VLDAWAGMLENALADETTSTPTLVRALFDHMGLGIEQFHGFYRGVFREIMKIQVGLLEGGAAASARERALAKVERLIARGQERGELSRDFAANDLAVAIEGLANGTINTGSTTTPPAPCAIACGARPTSSWARLRASVCLRRRSRSRVSCPRRRSSPRPRWRFPSSAPAIGEGNEPRNPASPAAPTAAMATRAPRAARAARRARRHRACNRFHVRPRAGAFERSFENVAASAPGRALLAEGRRCSRRSRIAQRCPDVGRQSRRAYLAYLSATIRAGRPAPARAPRPRRWERDEARRGSILCAIGSAIAASSPTTSSTC
jgi:hypothetical protein